MEATKELFDSKAVCCPLNLWREKVQAVIARPRAFSSLSDNQISCWKKFATEMRPSCRPCCKISLLRYFRRKKSFLLFEARGDVGRATTFFLSSSWLNNSKNSLQVFSIGSAGILAFWEKYDRWAKWRMKCLFYITIKIWKITTNIWRNSKYIFFWLVII